MGAREYFVDKNWEKKYGITHTKTQKTLSKYIEDRDKKVLSNYLARTIAKEVTLNCGTEGWNEIVGDKISNYLHRKFLLVKRSA